MLDKGPADDAAWRAAAVRLTAPPFAPLRKVIAALPRDRWPTLDDLNQLACDRLPRRDPPFRFVSDGDTAGTLHYETRIHARGEIVTRRTWHDLFNALVWLTFPALKAAISRRHAGLLAAGGAGEQRRRSPARDALTLFDESGMLVATEDATLLDLIRDFQWQTLFIDRRADVERRLTFTLVGHAVYEKMLTPYVGLTCKCLLLGDPGAAVERVTALAATRDMTPLPILGIPGWHAANATPEFYANREYFRSGYRQHVAGPGRGERLVSPTIPT